MKTQFNISELPLSQFEALGIYQDRQLLLEPEEIACLLSGRRTTLVSLHELKGKDFTIERLDARLSLQRAPSGQVELLLHPIYKNPRAHPLLSDDEMQELISGDKSFVARAIEREEGWATMYNIEYDKLTKDFVGYDVSKVQAPERVNGMLLDEEEKSAFQRGEILELADGTKIQHRASEPKGILSDRKALVLSVLLDGGISYLLVRGIRSLYENTEQKDHRSPAFNSALAEMEGAKAARQREFGVPELIQDSTARKVGR
ncbi:DUF4099 domain-containing protein [Pedobacter aquatilis]|uniref:DUF4099 domain-containing protein n=1 Tax=Pedobacter aquatilis TaxID=351343 RepID=UPI0025B46A87|nr:DUF4099 domain-containing protein [Pedobacter aquatilis]MDN3586172.1 DUF4099 domain-containing protein [Pedobacter aquatilis]